MMNPLHVLGFGAVFPSADAEWRAEIPAHLKRRDPRIWTLAYVAAARAMGTVGHKARSVCVGTALGALDETKSFLDGVFTDGFGSPRNFIASVHNSMAGKLALEFGISGPNLTCCDGLGSFASAIVAARLLGTDALPSLVVAVDEDIPLLHELSTHLSQTCGQSLADAGSDGAVALLLGNGSDTGHPRIRAVSPVCIGNRTPEFRVQKLAASFGSERATMESLRECRSFLGAARAVHARLASGPAGRHIIPAYSPSSTACSAIEVTV